MIPPDESSGITGHLLFPENLEPSGVLDWLTPISIMRTDAFDAVTASLPDHSCHPTRTIPAGPMETVGSVWLSKVPGSMLVQADHPGEERFRFKLEYFTRSSSYYCRDRPRPALMCSTC